ncbi:pilus assembly protein [Pelagibacterium lentulum]|uniref:Pilus assembly protein n=2 Tax=Pelagibacterium lentulum TaxID=2029865 RepID=A0A916VUZ9_9HYPH|nr:pilus assembly protein [Pelagibacterium lentulum]
MGAGACVMIKKIRQFLDNARGVAAVEFALIIPLLLTMFIGSVDLSQGISTDRKLANAVSTLGDLVAQAPGNIRQNILDDYFSASQAIMLPYDGSRAQLIVSVAHIDNDGVARILWSRAHNGASAHTQDSVYSLPSEITDIARDAYVVISEGSYEYRPVGGFVLKANIPLYKEFFYLPRFGEVITQNG